MANSKICPTVGCNAIVDVVETIIDGTNKKSIWSCPYDAWELEINEQED